MVMLYSAVLCLRERWIYGRMWQNVCDEKVFPPERKTFDKKFQISLSSTNTRRPSFDFAAAKRENQIPENENCSWCFNAASDNIQMSSCDTQNRRPFISRKRWITESIIRTIHAVELFMEIQWKNVGKRRRRCHLPIDPMMAMCYLGDVRIYAIQGFNGCNSWILM